MKKSQLTKSYILKKVSEALKEDFGSSGDITSNVLIPRDHKSTGTIISNDASVLCGIEFAKLTFKKLDKNIKFLSSRKDGSKISKGSQILKVYGNTRALLGGERTALNFLGFMSGISTKTSHFVGIANPFNSRIYSTRKTIAGLRMIEKYAVTIGGGHINRAALDSFYFVKDNHLKIQKNISETIKRIKRKKIKKKITFEVDNISQLKSVLNEDIDIVLLDNMKPRQILRCLKLIDGKFQSEVSGGINLSNIKSYAKTKVDRISIGELTHSIKNTDFSMDLK